MKCFLAECVVLYGADIRQIWNKSPGELQGRLAGGEYVLPMEEFIWTEMRDHPEAGSGIRQ